MKKITLILFFFIGSFFSVTAQDRVVDKKYTYWTRAYLEVKLNEKAKLDLEIDNRRYIVPHRQFQTLGRFTLEVRQNSWLSIGTGMAYSLLYSQLSNLTQPEIRPHQEVNIDHGSGNWKFNHRLRLEQRFIQDTIRQTSAGAGFNEFNEDTYSFSFRSRYQAAVAYTVINQGKQHRPS
jgi:hypothetical protein